MDVNVRVELANARLQALLDGADIRELALPLSPETVETVAAAAKNDSTEFEWMLALAFVCGLSADDVAGGLRELHELSSMQAALRFQVFKLERGLLLEEARARGVASQNETFEALSERLRERIRRAKAETEA